MLCRNCGKLIEKCPIPDIAEGNHATGKDGTTWCLGWEHLTSVGAYCGVSTEPLMAEPDPEQHVESAPVRPSAPRRESRPTSTGEPRADETSEWI